MLFFGSLDHRRNSLEIRKRLQGFMSSVKGTLLLIADCCLHGHNRAFTEAAAASGSGGNLPGSSNVLKASRYRSSLRISRQLCGAGAIAKCWIHLDKTPCTTLCKMVD